MRKIIVSMNITLDGLIAGPHCELDWHFNRWTTRMAQSLGEQLSQADTILLGRVTYCAMAKFWPSKSADNSLPREHLAFADMVNRYSKIVFSRTLETTCWENTSVVNGDILDEINRLKKLPGRDMIVYGSGTLVSKLMQLNLIDEYALWIHPVILGEGKPLFKRSGQWLDMQMFKTETFSSGVVKISYRVEKEAL